MASHEFKQWCSLINACTCSLSKPQAESCQAGPNTVLHVNFNNSFVSLQNKAHDFLMVQVSSLIITSANN